MQAGLAQMRTNVDKGLTACGRPQLSRPITELAALACSRSVSYHPYNEWRLWRYSVDRSGR